MIPTIDSTKLKYIADCLLKVNKDAPAQLGEEMMHTKDIYNVTMLTIEDKDGKKVIDTQPFTTQAESLKRGLDRFKGTITFAEDGKSHDIGKDVTVCHAQYSPGSYGEVPKITDHWFSRRAVISASSLRILTAQDMKQANSIIYLRNDSDGHYLGMLDKVRVKLKGNLEPPAYTVFAATYLKKLSAMARDSVTVEWDPESLLIRFGWEAYGLTMRFYVAPRIINDENIIKRLDRKVIL